MSNLLQKASIVTTPTAYGVGVLNSIKPAIPFGEELIVNGNFLNGTTNWTANSSTLSVTNNTLKVLSTGGFGNAEQNITVVSGQTYLISADFIYGGSVEGRLNAYDGSASPTEVGSSSDTNLSFYITISSGQTNLRVRLVNQSATTGVYNNWDNVSVKKVTDADFDFTRTSSATRVNPDYLIETVSINSANLVQNGNFSELGSELVTNGNFETDSNWNNSDGGNDWQIVNGKLILTTTSANNINQGIGLVQNKFYKIVFTISNTTLGGLRIRLGTGSFTSTYTDGTHTLYLEQTTTNDAFRFYADTSGIFNGEVDNVSVKQVDPNDNWIVTDSDANNFVEITQGQARLKFLNTSPITSLETSFVMTAGKKYKLTVDVLTVTSGAIKVDGAGISETFNVAGITTRIINPTGTTSIKFYRASADVDITLNSVSLIEIQENGVPRLDYTNGTASILLEPQSTNLITYSSDFSNSIWRKRTSDSTQAPVITINYAISPDGTQNATRVVITPPTLDNDYAVVDNFTSVTKNVGDKFTSSIYVKANGSSQIGKKVNLYQYENGYSTILTHSLTDNWVRLKLTNTMGLVTGNMETLVIGKARSSVGGSSLSEMATDFLIAFAQFEQQSFATSYIPTSGSTVTRAAETLNNAGSSDLINSTEGVLYAEIAAISNSASSAIFSINDGTGSNTLYVGFTTSSNVIQAQLVVGGAPQTNMFYTVSDRTIFNKVAVLYQNNNHKMFINGVQVATDTAGSVPSANTLDRINFDLGQGSFDFYGKCKTVAVFKEALSDTELACLTSTNNREIFLNYYYRMQYVGANTEALSCAEQTFNV